MEIPSGGSLAMAGMIQEQTKQQINGMPGLMQLPVLGALFKSRDYVNRQTELMVIVTPYIVRAVAQKDLSRPDDGFADASDPATDPARPLQPHLRRRRARPIRAGRPIAATTASFSTERATRRRSMNSATPAIAARPPRRACVARVLLGRRRRGARRLLHHDAATPPAAFRTTTAQRHPIAMKEGERTRRAVRRQPAAAG